MSRKARIKVHGRFDSAGQSQEATVEIDRDACLFSVRPYRRHRVYTLPLSIAAEMVCHRIILAEAAEKRAARKRKS